MKKIILLFAICFPFILSAQLTSDDFESYDLGSFDFQWDATNWVGWFNNASGSTISDEQAHLSTQSVKIEENDDLVALLGTLDFGTYEISFWQFVPSGNAGYINMQHNYTSTAGDWMFEVYVNQDGTGQFNTAGLGSPFTPVFDQWVEYKFNLNFIDSEGQFSYNGSPLVDFAINSNANNALVGLNQVNAINFFGGCLTAGTCTPLSYYDDVEVTYIPGPPHDARLINPEPASEYFTVPNGLEQPLNLVADVWNIGEQDITDVTVTFNVRDGGGGIIHTETSDPMAAIGSGEQASFVGNGGYTFTGADNYSVDYIANIAETDDDLTDNTQSLTSPFALDPSIYSRDDGNFDNGVGYNGGTGKFGVTYEFIDAATVESIILAFSGGAAGDTINGFIYSVNVDGSPDTVVATTEPFITTAVGGGIGSEIFATLTFTDGIEIDAGNYIFMVEQTSTTSLGVATSQNNYTPGTTWASADDIMWSNLENFGLPVPMAIRPFLSLVGVNTDESAANYVDELTISPNPTQDFVTIDLQLLETHDLILQIFNGSGQVIKTLVDNNTLGDQYQLDLSAYPNGIYFVKIRIGEQQLTRKVILMK
ncbi:MAG: T9SS type A sorting domain-containing protein [Saprospiraceae bacterium]